MKRLLVTGIAAAVLLGLGLYFAPREAYIIQEPFKRHGQRTVGVVTGKAKERRSYEGGGQDAGKKSYTERVVTVRIPREADRQVQIDHLVLAADYDSFQVGDEVEVVYIEGKHANEKKVYYLLSASVDAGTFALLPWAFNGRPAQPLAIATAIPGVIALLFFVAFLIDRVSTRSRRRR